MVKQNVVLFSFVTLGAIFFLYPDLKRLFSGSTESDAVMQDENDRITNGPRGRHLLSLDNDSNGLEKQFVSDSGHSSKRRIRRARRRKRSAHGGSELFSWNLTLNVGRYGHNALSHSNDDGKKKLGKGKYLGLSVLAEGNGTDESRTDLDQALDTVKHALKQLFRDNDTLEDGITVHVRSGSNETETWKKIPASKNKEGKFLLPGFFNLGSSSSSTMKPQQQTSSEEGLESVSSSTLVTKVSTEESSGAEVFAPLSTQGPSVSAPLDLTESGVTTELPIEVEENETLEHFCKRLLENAPVSPRFLDDFSDTGASSGDGFVETNAVGNGTSIVTDKPNSQRPNWISSILNVIRGSRPQNAQVSSTKKPEPQVKDASENERRGKLLGLGNFFVGFGSGRSVGDDSSLDLKFDKVTDDDESDDLSDILTVEECELFFKSLPTDAIFAKPNLLDILNNPLLLSQDPASLPVEVTHEDNDFRFSDSVFNESVVSKEFVPSNGVDKNSIHLTEQQNEVNSTDVPRLSHISEKPRTVSEENSVWNEISVSKENSIPTTKSPDESPVSEEILPRVETYHLSNPEFSQHVNDTDTGQSATTSQTNDVDERFFGGFMGLGSGEQSSDQDSENADQRFLSFLNLGSGERQLDESVDLFDNIETTTDKNENLSSASHNEYPSLDSQYIIETEAPGSFGTGSDDGKQRVFGFPSFGSGDGRDLDDSDCIDCTTEAAYHDGCLSGDCLDYDTLSAIKTDYGATTTKPPLMEYEVAYEDVSTSTKPPSAHKNDPRLISTLFLSGSGDGDLFGGGTGEINVVHENEGATPPTQRQRGARFDDFPDVFSQEESEFAPSAPPKTPTVVVNVNPEDEVFQPSTSTVGSTSAKTRARPEETSGRPCSSARECDGKLNERCITVDGSGVCDCGRSYVRHPETRRCEVPITVHTSLRLPGEVFHQDLTDKSTQRFQNKRKDALDTMWMLVNDDPRLASQVASVDVLSFARGSLVVNWELVLAADGSASDSQLAHQVDQELKGAFTGAELLRKSPLNVQDAVVLAVSAVDPCDHCSKNAKCVRDDEKGFQCECHEGYIDISGDGNNPGEVCIETCTKDYCGENGFCEVKWDGTRRCLCNNWYFGSRCSISGIVAVASFAGVNLAIVILVLVIVCLCRKRRRRQSSFYSQNQLSYQPRNEFSFSPRVLDSLAVNNCPVKSSKYLNISTPLKNAPIMRLNNMSLNATCSLDSDDYDSTFDRTPDKVNVSENQVSNV